MAPDRILDVLDSISIAVTAFLGISAVLTETKDPKGKLTAWGRIAVIGIAITSMFSFLQSYFKHEKEIKEKSEQQTKENNRLSEELERYKNQIALQDSVLHKIDTSLNKEVEVQSKADNLLGKVNEGIVIQRSSLNASYSINNHVEENIKKGNEILDQTSILYSQQKLIQSEQNKSFLKQIEINDNTIRTLNPIFPFAIKFELQVVMDSLIPEKFKKSILSMQSIIRTMRSRSLYELEGIDRLGDSNYVVTKKFSDYGIIEENVFAPFYISIYKDSGSLNGPFVKVDEFTSRKLTRHSINEMSGSLSIPGDLVAVVYPRILDDKKINYLGESYLSTPWQIEYSFFKNQFIVKIESREIEIISDKGKYRSPKDLQGSMLSIYLYAPAGMKQLENLSLFFPPNFSTELSFHDEIEKSKANSQFGVLEKFEIPEMKN